MLLGASSAGCSAVQRVGDSHLERSIITDARVSFAEGNGVGGYVIQMNKGGPTCQGHGSGAFPPSLLWGVLCGLTFRIQKLLEGLNNTRHSFSEDPLAPLFPLRITRVLLSACPSPVQNPPSLLLSLTGRKPLQLPELSLCSFHKHTCAREPTMCQVGSWR